jgi:hypothetical protein
MVEGFVNAGRSGRLPPRGTGTFFLRSTFMDRRSLIKNAGIAGVLTTGIAPAVHAQAAVRWRLASSFPKSLPTIFGSAEKFSETVGPCRAASSRCPCTPPVT